MRNWPENPASGRRPRPNSARPPRRKSRQRRRFSALTTEYEQLKINFGAEKNRAQEARTGTECSTAGKNPVRTGPDGDHQRPESHCQRAGCGDNPAQGRIGIRDVPGLRKNLESEHARLQQTEENLNTVTAAKEQSEASLQATIDDGQKDLARPAGRLDTAKSLLEEKEQAIKTLSEEIATVSSARESAEQELRPYPAFLRRRTPPLAERRRTSLSWRPVSILPDPRLKKRNRQLAEPLAVPLKNRRTLRSAQKSVQRQEACDEPVIPRFSRRREDYRT